MTILNANDGHERDKEFSKLYRFAEFGKAAAGIFHDLMNPLGVIALCVERLGEEIDKASPSVKDSIDTAIRAARKMESFMGIARKHLDEREATERFDPDKEARDAVDMLLHKAKKKGVNISFFPASRKLRIWGDPLKFFRVAANIISNAIDSYDKSDSEEKTVVVSTSVERETFFLAVEDRGTGIPRDLQMAIFEPFFTTKALSGLGLGLSTAKAIAEKDFGGRIYVKSDPGHGSLFVLNIPIGSPNTSTESVPREA
jgi:signal transduction histidine kinase